MSSQKPFWVGQWARLGTAGLMVWISSIVVTYLALHCQWISASAPAILHALDNILLALLLICLAGGVGKVLTRFAGDVLDALERAALEAAFGAGAMGFIALLAGLLGLYYRSFFWIVTAVGLLLFLRPALRWCRQFEQIPARFRATDRVGRIAAAISVGLCLLGLFQALAPPLKWDALVYHLTLPVRYLESHSLLITDDNPFLGMPQLAEMLYTWATALGSGTTAAVFGWAVGCLMLIGTTGFAARILGDRASFIPAAVLLSGATIARSLAWAYADIFSMLYGLVAVIALDAFRRSGQRRDLILAGILTGMAVWTKYSNLFLPLAISVVLFLGLEAAKVRLRSIAIYLLTTGAAAAPWLVKNLIQWGNPIYPLGFPSGRMDALRLDFYAGPPPARTLFDDLLLPLKATLQGTEGGPGYAADIGPLFLGLLPCLLLGWRSLDPDQRASLRPAIVLGAVCWVVWAGSSHLSAGLEQSRLYFSVFPGLAVLAAGGLESVRDLASLSGKVSRLLPYLVMLVFGIFGLREAVDFVGRNPLPVLVESQSPKEYLAAQLGWYEKAMEAVNRLPRDSSVLMLWEPRAYYCEVSCLPDTIIDRWYIARRKWIDPDAILRSWRDLGVTHVLYFVAGRNFLYETDRRYSESDWSALNVLLSELAVKGNIGDTYLLYEIQR